jgi:Uma2 family endonuclease
MAASGSGFEESGRPFLFTADDLPALLEAGVFERVDGRIELEDGRIVVVSPESGNHMRLVRRVVHLLQAQITACGKGGRFVVQPGGTIRLSSGTVYDTDACVVSPDFAGEGYLTPADVSLVIEAAVSSRARDLGRKKAAYAEAAVPEYWVLDGKHARLHVFARPTPNGWAEERALGPDDVVSPLFAPNIVLCVKDLL